VKCHILVCDLRIHRIKLKCIEKQKMWYKVVRHNYLSVHFFEITNRGLKITLNASLFKARVKYCPCLPSINLIFSLPLATYIPA